MANRRATLARFPALALVFWTVCAAGLLFGQSGMSRQAEALQKQATQRFAVVSIKADPPDYRSATSTNGPVFPGGKFVDRQAALARLIIFAYPQFAFPGKTLVGLPEWAYGGSLFDFEAEPGPGPVPSLAEMRQMMAAALADRFQLGFHVKYTQMPVFFLEVGQGGIHHMMPAAAGEPNMQVHLGPGRIVGRGFNTDELAAVVGFFFLAQGRPVVNRTRLSGLYDVDVSAAGGTYSGPEGNQTRIIDDLRILGLTLRSGTATVPVMVVNHVSRPTVN